MANWLILILWMLWKIVDKIVSHGDGCKMRLSLDNVFLYSTASKGALSKEF